MAPGQTREDPLPPGSATKAGAAPVSRETNTPAGAQARPPSYAEWLRARNQKPSDQNFIRYNNETGRAGLPGLPRSAETAAAAEAAANVGERFPKGDWQRFESRARPSSNVQDTRGNVISGVRDFLSKDEPLHWEVTPESAARFNANDPMTRQLMGDPSRMRSDVLRNMSNSEFKRWIDEMRLQRLQGGW